jgi:3D (Asp-Asp-Asp) domain-containing protein
MGILRALAPVVLLASPALAGETRSAVQGIPSSQRTGSFEATAYSIEGTTADGTRAREGVVAADPDILPLGSRIRIHGAGPYDGVYVVEDTGRAIRGRELDVYLRSDREAKRFGRKRVRVDVLERGDGRDGVAEAAPGPQRRPGSASR